MATFTSETVTTVTRRYLLPLPTNAAELGKMGAAVFAAWHSEHPEGMPDDAVTVTVEDNVLVYSWPVPGTDAVGNDEQMARAWDEGYSNHRAGISNPYRKTAVAEPEVLHAECGHAWSDHNGLGCMHRVPEGRRDFCPCKVIRR